MTKEDSEALRWATNDPAIRRRREALARRTSAKLLREAKADDARRRQIMEMLEIFASDEEGR